MTKPPDISQMAWEAANDAFDTMLCNDIRASGSAEQFRIDSITPLARAVDAADAKARRDQQQVIDFVRLWAWRENPKLTNTERLSAIKYHPAIRNQDTSK